MKAFDSCNSDVKTFVYFPSQGAEDSVDPQHHGYDLPRDILDKLLNVIGREVLREKTATMEELEQTLQDVLSTSGIEQNYDKQERGNS
ncbi:MAG TPA: hypothetical protein VE593_03465, partial [Nitrososphaeraceae archaeon]|nr:hypothetical protein [Nitrososphaeraceae archaeon]